MAMEDPCPQVVSDKVNHHPGALLELDSVPHHWVFEVKLAVVLVDSFERRALTENVEVMAVEMDGMGLIAQVVHDQVHYGSVGDFQLVGSEVALQGVIALAGIHQGGHPWALEGDAVGVASPLGLAA